jgi:Carboxypeptidase regulatory-like domain
MMHRRRWIIGLATVVTISTATTSIFSSPLAGQEPAATPQSKSGSAESSSTSKGKHSHANDLLIRGTVFNEHGLSMQGVRLRIQRADAKKPHWETATNFRGEFAVRVPPGADYQIAAEIKGFAKQSQAVNGKDGAAEEKVIFHMEPVNEGKGGKP